MLLIQIENPPILNRKPTLIPLPPHSLPVPSAASASGRLCYRPLPRRPAASPSSLCRPRTPTPTPPPPPPPPTPSIPLRASPVAPLDPPPLGPPRRATWPPRLSSFLPSPVTFLLSSFRSWSFHLLGPAHPSTRVGPTSEPSAPRAPPD